MDRNYTFYFTRDISLTETTSSSDEESPVQIAKLQPPETDKGMQLCHSVFLIYSQIQCNKTLSSTCCVQGLTGMLTGGGGGCIFIYSYSERRVSCQIKFKLITLES